MNTAFEQELKQFKTELDLLYKKAQAMFLRHGHTAPQASSAILPHLETAKNAAERLLAPTKKPAKLSDPGD